MHADVDDLSTQVPPSGGFLEIGNWNRKNTQVPRKTSSPFGGIPRNWKRFQQLGTVQHWGYGSPFGGIPRNWKRPFASSVVPVVLTTVVPPSGGFLEIGNFDFC